MCGRTAMPLDREEVRQQVSRILRGRRTNPERWVNEEAYRPSHNVAPTYMQPVIRVEGESHQAIIHTMKWGLIPFWTKRQPDYATMLKTINCRDDSLFQNKGMWNSLKGKKRCIVIVKGFYEWLKRGKEKQPYFTCHKDGKLMCLAGLYDSVKYENSDETIWTYTIITTSSNKQLSFLHDRMPVILNEDDIDTWLDPNEGWSEKLVKLLKPYEKELNCYPVSRGVGKVGNDSPDFIVPLDSKENKSNIANFFTKAPTNIVDDGKKIKGVETVDGSERIKVATESTAIKRKAEDGIHDTPSKVIKKEPMVKISKKGTPQKRKGVKKDSQNTPPLKKISDFFSPNSA